MGVGKCISGVILSMAISHLSFGQHEQLLTKETKQYLSDYYFAMETNNTDKALEALNALIAADPDFPHYYGARASVMESTGAADASQILADLDKAVSLDSFSAQWLQRRADFCWETGTDKMRYRALHDMRELIARDTLTVTPIFKMYPVIANGDSAYAIELLEEAIKRAYQFVVNEPNDAQHWFWLAQSYMLDTGQLIEENVLLALGYLDKAISLNPTEWNYILFRADIYDHIQHNYIAAIEDYNYVLTISTTPNVYAALILAYQRSGERELAKETLEKALLIFPGNYRLMQIKKGSH